MNDGAPAELAPKYYLRHFDYLLDFVQRQYGPLLHAPETALVATLDALSEDARCLFIRLSNRRQIYFRSARLNYPELADLDACLAELWRAGLLVRLGAAAPRRNDDDDGDDDDDDDDDGNRVGDDVTDNGSGNSVDEFDEFDDDGDQALAALCRVFTKAELLELAAPEPALPANAAKLGKPALVAALAALDRRALLARIAASEVIVRPTGQPVLTLFKFLFFGTPFHDMAQFVIRDLGHRRFERVDENRLVPRFTERRQIDDVLGAHLAYREMKALLDEAEPATLIDWYRGWRDRAGRLDPAAQPQCDRLALRLGRWLERRGEAEAALAVYADTGRPPARERRARLLAGLRRDAEALRLCRHIVEQPADHQERLFAEDFLRRLEIRGARRRTTEALRRAETLPLPAARRAAGGVEQTVLAHYDACGYRGFFAENHLWRALFGLLLWDELFDPQAGALHHPLQAGPSDLYRERGAFLAARGGRVEQRLARLADREHCLQTIQATLDAKWGLANPFVHWHPALPEQVRCCLRRLDGDAVRRVLLELASDLVNNGRGFPDLFLWRDDTCRFVEVKAPNDQLRPQQLFWLDFFAAHGIPAALLKVVWT